VVERFKIAQALPKNPGFCGLPLHAFRDFGQDAILPKKSISVHAFLKAWIAEKGGFGTRL
jgi:hypothetical protein